MIIAPLAELMSLLVMVVACPFEIAALGYLLTAWSEPGMIRSSASGALAIVGAFGATTLITAHCGSGFFVESRCCFCNLSKDGYGVIYIYIYMVYTYTDVRSSIWLWRCGAIVLVLCNTSIDNFHILSITFQS